MKALFFSIVALLVSCSAFAGSSGCSNSSSLTWYQASPYYTAASSNCIVNATQGGAGTTSLLVTLPASPSNGDTFTFVDKTPYSLDACGSYYDDPQWGGTGNTYGYCSPAGIGLESTTSAQIGNADWGYAAEVVDGEIYYTSCTDANNQACSLDGYPTKQRDAIKVVFNSSTGNWDLTVTAAQ